MTSPDTSQKEVKKETVVVTSRVLRAIVQGDLDARRALLHLNNAARESLVKQPGPLADLLAGAATTFQFVAPARVREEFKAFLNALITDPKANPENAHKISYAYAAHLFSILLAPIRLEPPETCKDFVEQAQKQAGDTPDADYVALQLATKAIGVWDQDAPPGTWPAGTYFLESTRDLFAVAGVPLPVRVLQSKVVPDVSETGAAATTLEEQGQAAPPATPLPPLPEPSHFDPDAVEWALRYFGLWAGPDFRVPVFLEDLPPVQDVKDITSIDFSARPNDWPKDGGYLTVNILHALRVPDHYRYVFINREQDPHVNEFFEAFDNWNVDDTDEDVDGRIVPRAREHVLYWGTAQTWGGEKPPYIFSAGIPAALIEGGEDSDSTRDIFLASDSLDKALKARQAAVADFLNNTYIKLGEFEKNAGFLIDPIRYWVYSGILHFRLKTASTPSSGGNGSSSQSVANFAAGPFIAFIRGMDTTLSLRVDIIKTEKNPDYPQERKPKTIKILYAQMKELKDVKYEGQL